MGATAPLIIQLCQKLNDLRGLVQRGEKAPFKNHLVAARPAVTWEAAALKAALAAALASEPQIGWNV
jgi:hypothetical protein